jgi:hypothetical protein
MCFCATAQSQELYDHKLDKDKWSDIRDNIRYESYEPVEWTYDNYDDYLKDLERYENGEGSKSGGEKLDEGVEHVMTPEKSEPRKSSNFNPNVNLAPFGWVLLVIFVIAAIGLIVYIIMQSGKDVGKVKVAPVDYLDDTPPAEIPLTELQRLLKDALDKNDYRGAIRIYYLFILRDISKKNWIKWEREKTNMHYLREMSSRPEYHEFDTSVGFYEIVWYGKREVNQEQFKLIQPSFTSLLDKLGVK